MQQATFELRRSESENTYKNENRSNQIESESKTQSTKLSKFRKVEFVFSVLNRLLIGFVTFYMCWMCLRIGDWEEIPWHALFCTLGFLCLMSEGILAHYLGNPWTQACYRNEKTRMHWILQLLGASLGISGVLIKISLEERHFYSSHGKIGLATLIILFWSLMTGLSSLYAHEMRQRMQPMLNKAIHTVLGLTTYGLSILSIFSSFETDIFLQYSLDGNHYIGFCLFLKVTVLCIFVLSSYGPIWCLVYSKFWKCC